MFQTGIQGFSSVLCTVLGSFCLVGIPAVRQAIFVPTACTQISLSERKETVHGSREFSWRQERAHPARLHPDKPSSSRVLKASTSSRPTRTSTNPAPLQRRKGALSEDVLRPQRPIHHQSRRAPTHAHLPRRAYIPLAHSNPRPPAANPHPSRLQHHRPLTHHQRQTAHRPRRPSPPPNPKPHH